MKLEWKPKEVRWVACLFLGAALAFLIYNVLAQFFDIPVE